MGAWWISKVSYAMYDFTTALDCLYFGSSNFGSLKKSGPVSRVLSRRLLSKPTGWPSLWDAPRGTPLATYPATPATRVALGRTVLKAALFGLAPDGVYPATRLTAGAVSSYLAVSPLPLSRRFVFCGTFHRLAASGR